MRKFIYVVAVHGRGIRFYHTTVEAEHELDAYEKGYHYAENNNWPVKDNWADYVIEL